MRSERTSRNPSRLSKGSTFQREVDKGETTKERKEKAKLSQGMKKKNRRTCITRAAEREIMRSSNRHGGGYQSHQRFPPARERPGKDETSVKKTFFSGVGCEGPGALARG